MQGRRAEFANLDSHEAKLRLAGATRQMAKIGFEPTIFAPPRWRMSPGTLQVLPQFKFEVAASTRGVLQINSGKFHQARNMSFGEGFGSAKWWRKNIIRNTVRLSVSGRNLDDRKVIHDFVKAADRAINAGATPADYGAFLPN